VLRWTGTTNGNVTSYTISVSTDGSTFTEVTRGTWPVDPHYNGLLSPQRVQFEAQSARYVSFQADAVAGGGTEAIVGEAAVGSSEAAIGDGGAEGGDATFDAGAEGDIDTTSDNGIVDAFSGGDDVGWESEASRLVPAGSDGAAAGDGSRESSTGDATPDGSSRAGAASPSDAGCTCNLGETRSTPWGPAAIVACVGVLLARGRRRKT